MSLKSTHIAGRIGAFLTLCVWIIGGEGAGWAADFRVTPSLSVSEQYNDNIRFSSAGKEADFATLLSTVLSFKGREQEIDVAGSVGTTYSAYLKNSDLDRVSSLGGVSLGASSLAGRLLPGLSLSLSDNYIYTQEFPTFAQFGQTNQPTSGGVQTARVTTFSNSLGVNSAYPVSARSSMVGSYNNTYTHFGGGSGLVNTIGNSLSGGWSYTLTPATTLTSSALYSRFSFGGGSSFDTYGGNVGLSHQFLADLTISANVGGSYLPSQDRILPTFSLSLIKKFSAATNLGLSAARSVGGSGGLAAAASTNQVLSAFVSHQATQSLIATLSANYSMTKTVGIQTVDITSYGLSGGLFYTVNRWVNLTASSSYFKQQSQGILGSSLDGKSVQIGLTVTWQ